MPKLLIDWVEIESNYFPEWPTASHKSILIESPNKDDEPTYVREVLSNFMRRAYRRPVSKDEVERKAALFARLRPKEDSFEHTLVSTLAAVLCSSHFLLIAEPSTQPVAEDEPIRKRKLNNYELASRLSYFLWSSMPDQMLFELAENGQISQQTVLKKQVLRMIRDPKALAFSTHFASQWLDLAGIRRLAVNPEYFTFEETTKDLFEQETIRFLHHVVQENLSIDNFIDSDFVVTQHKLAKHYRILVSVEAFMYANLVKNITEEASSLRHPYYSATPLDPKLIQSDAECGCLNAFSTLLLLLLQMFRTFPSQKLKTRQDSPPFKERLVAHANIHKDCQQNRSLGRRLRELQCTRPMARRQPRPKRQITTSESHDRSNHSPP